MLTTLAKAKSLIGLDIPDEDLKTLLMVSSQFIEEYCRRKFKKQTYSVKVDGLKGGFIRLPNYPVHTISADVDGDILDGIEALDDGILYRSDGWPVGIRTISITYMAGYVLPEEATEANPSTLPETIEYACILLAKHLQREHGVTSERVGDISVSYAADQMDMPMAVKSLLAPHVRPDM
ncbi:hypothetical protein BCV73_08860 [Paenibacillus sp. SSG-1]|uniref:hypothetical protein n=1 Tax=Paenibacillus sp. SSG-1 TaxID=1443669 RepID=UPI000B7C7197|nr:hypothetical protein [Paenibacillus sp. SSG-1]OXL83175.1 hypothetical protein BCV73_08860 [Paenibacillus sp. SSG-1]